MLAALASLDAANPEYATQFVQGLLSGAIAAKASDIHLQPSAEELDVRLRLDGVLQPMGSFPRGDQSDVVVRLKVMANLLTYQSEVPQEGRLIQDDIEMRVSTFPTLFGERAVIRIFGQADLWDLPESLGYDGPTLQSVHRFLAETAGMVLFCGPAGSGKTTACYAMLRHLLHRDGQLRSLVTLEDPVETVVPGTTQSAVRPAAGFDFARGLRSLLRQDPDAIMIGEIRDKETMEAAFQAALTGHLVISTFHAGSVLGALRRLQEMELEPYVVNAALLGLVAQRLARKLCPCKRKLDSPESLQWGLEVAFEAVGCGECRGTGYQGRQLIAECLDYQSQAWAHRLARLDQDAAVALLRENQFKDCWQSALDFVKLGQTSPSEVRRLFGLRPPPTAVG